MFFSCPAGFQFPGASHTTSCFPILFYWSTCDLLFPTMFAYIVCWLLVQVEIIFSLFKYSS